MRRDTSIGVIALVPDRWRDIVMPRHQVLRRLARHFNVVWVEPAVGWRHLLRPGAERFLHRDEWCSPVEGLHVLDPGAAHPLVHRPEWLARWTLASRLAAARRRLVDLGASRVVLYVWRDEFAAALDLVEHDVSCYHIDDEYTFGERDMPVTERERGLLRAVDEVVIHSTPLMKKKGAFNPHTTQVPNGVDFASYTEQRAIPEDLARVPAPRIGYAGVIKKQLDLDLLGQIASARPGYSFVLVGPVLHVAGKEPSIRRLESLPNVHFLGNKPVDALPAYVQHFDVSLMCYEVNDYTKYIYPLKLHEYLAAGQPVVSARIPAVLAFESVVTLAASLDEWLVAIDRGLEAQSRAPSRVEARRDASRSYDWNRLVSKIAERFLGALARKASTREASARRDVARS